MKKKLFFILTIILIVLSVNLNSCMEVKTENPEPKDLPTSSINSPEEIRSSPEILEEIKQETPTTNTKITILETKYGHFPYQESDVQELVIIASYAQGKNQRFERLAREAAEALMKLIYAARDDGVWIVPVSGFRSIDHQTKLFNRQVERRGSPEAAAKISAPPGYSEHHTGYTIDLTDGRFPKLDITNKFAETQAFKWLESHGREFDFELSFPKNNSQGISYEPWHWRYIGSPKAKEIFNLNKNEENL